MPGSGVCPFGLLAFLTDQRFDFTTTKFRHDRFATIGTVGMEAFITVREKAGKTLAVMLIGGPCKPTSDQLCVVITLNMVLVAVVGLVVFLGPASVQIVSNLPSRIRAIPWLMAADGPLSSHLTIS